MSGRTSLGANAHFVKDARTGSWTVRQLASKYGYIEKSVATFCRTNRIEVPRIRPLYTVNSSFFETLNSKSAYVLGWMAADGCVHSAEARITISLHSKDTSILQSIKEMMCYSGPLRTYETPQNVCVLSISSQKIVEDLAKYGIIPRKTHVLEYPKLPDHLQSHFMRGYSDGDGCITGDSERGFVWKLSGRYEFLEKFRQHIQIALGEELGGLHRDKSIYTLSFGGRRCSLKALDFLYAASTPATRLSRKYDKYLDALAEAEAARRCTRFKKSEDFVRDAAAGDKSVSTLVKEYGMPYHVVYNWVLAHRPEELHDFSKKRPRRQRGRTLRGVEKLNTTFRVRIRKDGQIHKGGTFDTEHAAISAYNELATSLYGEHAILNEVGQ